MAGRSFVFQGTWRPSFTPPVSVMVRAQIVLAARPISVILRYRDLRECVFLVSPVEVTMIPEGLELTPPRSTLVMIDDSNYK